ncbi:MAG: hypothetical protein D6806_11190, partial [Deltaproteobacteria bacterium]
MRCIEPDKFAAHAAVSRQLSIVLLVLAICCPPAPGLALERKQFVVRNNRVIIDEVYWAILDLPKWARPDEKTAKLVRRQILRFLRKSGYLLARVKVRAERGRLIVDVDEGQL